MRTRSLAGLIGAHPFFDAFPKPYLAEVTGCASNQRFAVDAHLTREAEPADRFFLIREGRVAIEVRQPSGGPMILDTVEGGQILGWSWIMAPYRYHFDSRALTPVYAIAFDAACLRGKCDADPALGYDLLKRFTGVMLERFQATRVRLLDLYSARP